MRLLVCSEAGKFSLTESLVGDDPIPPYAILSRTWLADSEEPTFEDLTNGTGEEKPGYEKIRFCGEQARRDGLYYFWVDTCCINKKTPAELSHAINSMFRWYRNAARCYVYLSDVPSLPYGTIDNSNPDDKSPLKQQIHPFPPSDTNDEFNPRSWDSDFGKASGSLAAGRSKNFLLLAWSNSSPAKVTDLATRFLSSNKSTR
jgi:hypothetical protein